MRRFLAAYGGPELVYGLGNSRLFQLGSLLEVVIFRPFCARPNHTLGRIGRIGGFLGGCLFSTDWHCRKVEAEGIGISEFGRVALAASAESDFEGRRGGRSQKLGTWAPG